MPESSYTDFTAFGEEEHFEITPAGKPARTRAVETRTAETKKRTTKARPAKVKSEKTKALKTKPIKKRAVRKAEFDIEAVVGKGKKRSKGRAFLCAFGALAVVMASVAGAGCYFGGIDIEDFLNTGSCVEAGQKGADKEQTSGAGNGDAIGQFEQFSEKTTKKMIKSLAVDKSHPAYEVAESILEQLECGNDVDTAWNIFNWVHSNILYQTVFEDQSYEDAAYMGFTRRSGDCYVYFSCAKMLLDCAGIPNMMVVRYPVVTNGHYWNLVQLNGEWYHCDATVFRDRYEMYFMCTDDEIDDGHHDFDHSLYPERASGYSGYQDDWWGVDTNDWNDPYTDDYDDYDDWNDDWNDYDDWNDDDWNDYYNEIDDNVEVWEDDFEDDWN